MAKRLLSLLSLILAGSLPCHSALAQDPAERLQQIMASPANMERAIKAGKKAAFLCVHCHGESGVSIHGHIPNLAGQNPIYLLTQIEKFRDGRRQNQFMSGLIKLLKEDDILNMAIYFSSQSVSPDKSKDVAQVAKGRQIYTQVCKGCHGLQGYGERHIARLAGQHAEYIGLSLERYRQGAKERSDPVMGNIAKQLKDPDIAALAAYLSTLP